MNPSAIPISTYRIQFNKHFRFLDCREIVPYLHDLGIGALYSSPRYRARRGSEHGYDVSSPLRVNSELGTDEEFDDLCERLRHYGLGMVLDIVPNHMVASHENPWWMDVLENGPGSPFARYFDIDWHPTASKAAFLQENKVLVPVLGDLYGNVLANQELTVRLDDEGFFLRYYDRRFPLDPKSYSLILDACLVYLEMSLGIEHAAIAEVRKLARLASELPPNTVTDAGKATRRQEAGRSLKRRLFAVYRDIPEARLAIDAALADLAGNKGDVMSCGRLHELLEQQSFRLAYWKIAFEEINYRRFFDINDLVCLRTEEEDIFDARHAPVFQLLAERKVTGLRVDHIDGLRDPSGYLSMLDKAVRKAAADDSTYVVVEKVLGRGESLPSQWNAQGTTGYDFLNALSDLLLHPEGLQSLSAIYAKFTGEEIPFGELCYARNKQVMWKLFAGEVNVLGHHLGQLAAQDREARDVPLSELMEVLVEVTACLPVYRTYIRDLEIDGHARYYLERTLELARTRTSEVRIGDPAFHFLRRVLLLDPPPYAPQLRDQFLAFVMRWQQFTGPVMAKGLEDTASYIDNTLISRNEVGGDALREEPPLDLAGFHTFCAARLQECRYTMNATSTHDTKRSEDVRARLHVLSEMPLEWEKHLLRWRRWNRPHKKVLSGQPTPTPGEEVLLYQTLAGVWPLDESNEAEFLDRIRTFLVKAMREAKTYSGWIRPDESHESAVLDFSAAILDRRRDSPFLRDFLRFQEKLAWHGALNSLTQTLIKITAPGIPDFYQGSELWDLSLVDPDNRRPVDFQRRIALLECLRVRQREAPHHFLKELLTNWKDGRIKLHVTEQALGLRRAKAGAYLEGAYTALETKGPKGGNVCAFARSKNGTWCLTVAPLWTSRIAPFPKLPVGRNAWRDTRLVLPDGAPTQWRNVFTGESVTAARIEKGELAIPMHEVLHRFPVALLANHEPVRGRRQRNHSPQAKHERKVRNE
ncbi:MAG: malto-oligosyltrehalose synthase [Acidobacteria bacterium]|nr:malto-oligosyltrehalose synthase [Acidobacteriota bacterium]